MYNKWSSGERLLKFSAVFETLFEKEQYAHAKTIIVELQTHFDQCKREHNTWLENHSEIK